MKVAQAVLIDFLDRLGLKKLPEKIFLVAKELKRENLTKENL